jgi:hypothetical protein
MIAKLSKHCLVVLCEKLCALCGLENENENKIIHTIFTNISSSFRATEKSDNFY